MFVTFAALGFLHAGMATKRTKGTVIKILDEKLMSIDIGCAVYGNAYARHDCWFHEFEPGDKVALSFKWDSNWECLRGFDIQPIVQTVASPQAASPPTTQVALASRPTYPPGLLRSEPLPRSTSSSSADSQWFPRLYAIGEQNQIDEIPATQAEQAEAEPQQAEQAEQAEQNQAEQVVAVDNSVLEDAAVPDYEDTESTVGLRGDIEQDVLSFLALVDQ